MARLLAAMALFCLVGCDQCGDEGRRVPFKLDGDAAAAADAAPARAADAGAPISLQFDAGAANPEVLGAALPAEGVRAVLAIDLDADGDQDAILLAQPAPDRLALLRSQRDENGFSAPTPVANGDLAVAKDCELAAGTIRALAPRLAVVDARLKCSDEDQDSARQVHLALSVEARPRVLERFEVLPEAGRVPGEVALTATAQDLDGDGHVDLALQVALTAPGAAPAELQLAWLDRPSGLARDVREPGTSLSAMAAAASGNLAKDSEQALAAARGTQGLHRLLCRESGMARLALSGVAGLGCGRSRAAAEAAATATIALARAGDILAALKARKEIEAPGLGTTAKLRKAADAALSKIASEPGLSLTAGPQLPSGGGSEARLPRVRFLDRENLWLDTSPPQHLHWPSGQLSPATAVRKREILDPSGRWMVTAVERSCEGYVVRFRAVPPPGPIAVGFPTTPPPAPGPARQALLHREPVPGKCASLPPGQRRNDGGFRLLGWAPQGLLAARRDALHLVPLTLEGKSAGAPRELAPDTPTPAPLPSGRATPDGTRYVTDSPLGPLVFRRGAQVGVALWRPTGWRAGAAGLTDLALSPDGHAVAGLRNGQVFVIAKRSASPD